MANFCKYCGKALQDGEICSCPQAQAEAAQMYQGQQPPQGFQQPPMGYPQQAAPNPAGNAFQKLVPFLKSYFSAPVSAVQGLVAQKEVIIAAVLLCVQLIVGGLMTFSFVGSYLKNNPIVRTGIQSITMRPYYGNDIMEDIEDGWDDNDTLDPVKGFSANFLMSLLFGILATAVAICLFVVIAFLVSKIAGSQCSFIDVLVACGGHSPIVTILLLLTFILFFVSLPVGLICLVATALAWIVLAIPTLQTLAPNSSAQSKFWISAFVGILLTALVGTWAAYSIGSMSVGYASYKKGGKTHTLNEMRDEEYGRSYVSSALIGDVVLLPGETN